jgi:hypothetical protein
MGVSATPNLQVKKKKMHFLIKGRTGEYCTRE